MPTPQPPTITPPVAPAGWNGFVGNMRLPLHRWFRFSAGFPALWAEDVIRQTGADHVLDPFAGSGTTLLASQLSGAESIGLESQPFIFRIAHAKLQWTADPDAFLERGRGVLAEATPNVAQESDVAPLLTKCFPQGTLAALAGLRTAVEKAREGDGIDDLLWLALVSILRPCSPVGTAQWQYVLPNKAKARATDPFEAFESQLVQMADDMRQLQASSQAVPAAEVKAADSREPFAVVDGWADLVLTSPPYPNNFDYADATRLEMTFLGEIQAWSDLKTHVRKDLVRSCSQHMSGYQAEDVLDSGIDPITEELWVVYDELTVLRSERPGKKAYNWMVVAYFADLALVWENLRRAVAPGGLVGFVVGDSAPYGVHVPVERWLGEIAVARGFKSYRFEKLRDRNHKWLNRKHRVPLQEGVLWVEG